MIAVVVVTGRDPSTLILARTLGVDISQIPQGGRRRLLYSQFIHPWSLYLLRHGLALAWQPGSGTPVRRWNGGQRSRLGEGSSLGQQDRYIIRSRNRQTGLAGKQPALQP